jgi:hypothetical protein
MAKQSTASVTDEAQTTGDGSEVIIPNEKINVTTLLIEVATLAYPINLYMVIEKFKSQNMSFSMTPPRVDIEGLGYAVVTPVQRPEGNVVTEGQPELVDGEWKQTWVVREYNESELAAQLEYAKITANDNIMAVRNADFEVGMKHTVGDKTFNVQLRIEDRINLIGMYTIGKEMVSAGSEQLEPFRSYQNETIMLTPQQTVDMALSALAAVKAISQSTWDLKDLVDAATKVADIPEIPTTFIPA